MHINRQVVFWLVAFSLLILVLSLLQEILLPFVAGIIIAFFLDPVADRLVKAGLNRTLASVLIVGTGGAIVLALIAFLAPLVYEQALQLADALPKEADRFKELVNGWGRTILGDGFAGLEISMKHLTDTLTEKWPSVVSWLATSVWSRGLALVNFFSLLLVTPLVVFYLLDSWNPMLAKIDGWLPRDHAGALRNLAYDMNNAVAAFVRGQGLVCLILGAFYATMLTTLGLKYGLLIGIATGIFAFVPFVGWAMGLLTALAFAAVQHWPDWLPLIKVATVFAAGQALDVALLSPKIVGTKIGLHPVWLIFALFVFSYLFGFVGMLVAVPVAAAIAVFVRFCLGLYLQSTVYRGSSASPGNPA